MKNIFSYDSKAMELLSYVGDLIILNMVFFLCCLPVVTIGAAQAGLFTAVRVLSDPEDDSSCVRAFFRGFKSGFGKITLAFLFFAALEVLLLYMLMMFHSYKDTGRYLPWGIPAVLLCLTMAVYAQIPLFHARFQCNALQLFRNAFLFLFMYPVRGLLAAALLWGPLVLFMLYTNLFLKMGGLFLAVYYSAAFLIVIYLTKKPFRLVAEAVDKEETGKGTT